MKFIVDIIYRDDTVEVYECWNEPYLAEWVILYLNDESRTRKIVPKEAVKSISYSLSL